MPWGPNHCDKIRDIEEAIPREIEANDIVFSVHIPLPPMEMSPWFQFMLFILQLDIAFKLNNQISKCTLLSPSLPLGISLITVKMIHFLRIPPILTHLIFPEIPRGRS
jgi:hypothetical protein